MIPVSNEEKQQTIQKQKEDISENRNLIEAQILTVGDPVQTPALTETSWRIFFRRVKAAPIKATAEFAPKVWQSRRMKIATFTFLPVLIACLVFFIFGTFIAKHYK